MKVLDLTNPLIAVAGLVLVAILLRLQLRQRQISIKRLWVVPALIAVLTTVHLVGDPPGERSAWALLLVALLLGLAVGLARAQFVDIRHVDPTRGVLLVQSSLLGVLVWFAVFAARVVLRQVFADADRSTVQLLTESLLLVATGTVIANAIWTYRLYARTGTVTQFS